MTALRPGQSPPPVSIPIRATYHLLPHGVAPPYRLAYAPNIPLTRPASLITLFNRLLNKRTTHTDIKDMRLGRGSPLRVLGVAALLLVALAAARPATAEDLDTLKERAQAIA